MAGTALSASVGSGCANQAADVGLVQIFLNVMRGIQKKPLLKVDGVCGAPTIAAIREFQAQFTGHADGRVDPNGRTLRTLIFSYMAVMRLGVDIYPFPPSFGRLAMEERPDGVALGRFLRDGLNDLERGIASLLKARPGASPGAGPNQPSSPGAIDVS
ncbi:MAG TPA: peptidoglycan-binding domain-containing protein [Bryobacteraceae bacterium]|jgi:hypothetical protein